MYYQQNSGISYDLAILPLDYFFEYNIDQSQLYMESRINIKASPEHKLR